MLAWPEVLHALSCAILGQATGNRSPMSRSHAEAAPCRCADPTLRQGHGPTAQGHGGIPGDTGSHGSGAAGAQWHRVTSVPMPPSSAHPCHTPVPVLLSPRPLSRACAVSPRPGAPPLPCQGLHPRSTGLAVGLAPGRPSPRPCIPMQEARCCCRQILLLRRWCQFCQGCRAGGHLLALGLQPDPSSDPDWRQRGPPLQQPADEGETQVRTDPAGMGARCEPTGQQCGAGQCAKVAI